jgi:hypothetical protein
MFVEPACATVVPQTCPPELQFAQSLPQHVSLRFPASVLLWHA